MNGRHGNASARRLKMWLLPLFGLAGLAIGYLIAFYFGDRGGGETAFAIFILCPACALLGLLTAGALILAHERIGQRGVSEIAETFRQVGR